MKIEVIQPRVYFGENGSVVISKVSSSCRGDIPADDVLRYINGQCELARIYDEEGNFLGNGGVSVAEMQEEWLSAA